MLNMYGLKNCDTVKKARAWLQAQGTEFEFCDLKQPGVAAELLNLVAQHGSHNPNWETLLNRRGTTWRGLPPEAQANVTDQASAFALMLSHPSLIKRPVTVWPHTITVGFEPGLWATHLAALRN